MANKKRQSSSLITALITPAIILGSYAIKSQLRPSEDRLQVLRLEEELEQVKANAIAPERNLAVVQQIAAKRDELQEVESKFDDLRRQAGEMMRAKFAPMMELTTGEDINRVLSEAGMRFVDERPV
ncbi:MAG: hypothetical protein AAGJ83_09850, partial [Planctomycetota bacterium]